MRRITVVTLAATALFTLGACSIPDTPSSSAASASSEAESMPDDTTGQPKPVGSDAVPESKYTQTWTRRYDKTSCKQYQSVMTPHQRWVAAAEMLTAARQQAGSNEIVAPDALVDGFAEGIDMACTANRKFNIALAAAGLYAEDVRFQQ